MKDFFFYKNKLFSIYIDSVTEQKSFAIPSKGYPIFSIVSNPDYVFKIRIKIWKLYWTLEMPRAK